MSSAATEIHGPDLAGWIDRHNAAVDAHIARMRTEMATWRFGIDAILDGEDEDRRRYMASVGARIAATNREIILNWAQQNRLKVRRDESHDPLYPYIDIDCPLHPLDATDTMQIELAGGPAGGLWAADDPICQCDHATDLLWETVAEYGDAWGRVSSSERQRRQRERDNAEAARLRLERETAYAELAKSKATRPSIGRPAGYTCELIDSATFAARTYSIEWLIRRVMVKGQPLAIGGAMKTLKTSISVDLTISLGSGTPWLGYFGAPRKVRTAMLSGESGEPVLNSTARRVCNARGIDLAACSCFWGFRLPKLANDKELAELQRGLADAGAEVVILDPLYLALLSGSDDLQASNLFDMGPLLMAVAQACLEIGATPVVCHHFRRSIPDPPAVPELNWLAYSGLAEFARQWVLLGRREKFDAETGMHPLWAVIGGSAGHHGLYAIDVDEGRMIDDDPLTRPWSVSVRSGTEERVAAARAKADAKAAAKAEQRRKLLEILRRYPGGETAKVLRTDAGMNPATFAESMGALITGGLAITCKVMKGRAYDGFRAKGC